MKIKYFENNFNLLRLIAAFFIFFEQSFSITGNVNPVSFLGENLGLLGLRIFFVVSGYLVVNSWNNYPDAVRFLFRRVARIFPGLIVVVLFSAYIVGPLISKYSLQGYFSNSGVFFYLNNLIFFPVFSLPGVLELTHLPNVINGSLWTIPLMFALYLSVAFLGCGRAIGKHRFFVFFIGFVSLYVLTRGATDPIVFYGTDWLQFFSYGLYFYSGAFFAILGYKGDFSIDKIIGAFFILCLSISQSTILFEIVKVFIFSYLILTFSLFGDRVGQCFGCELRFFYGFYLYSFVVQQLVFHMLTWYGIAPYILISFSITALFSIISWYLIERPTLSFCLKF